MPSCEDERRVADQSGSLRGWDLGIVLPERAKPQVFLPGKARCAICQRDITDQKWRLFQTCDFWKCRGEHRRQQRAERREREARHRRQRQQFEKRMRQLRDEAAALLGIDEPERFVPAAVPAVERPVTCLPQERRSALRDHLVQLMAEADEKRNGSPRDPQSDAAPAVAADGGSPSPILQRACATCQGYCCLRGQDRAYLDVASMLRYLDEYPSRQPPEVLDAFLSRVEQSTSEDSCVYHGENGCSLPRPMRSGTCNGFECNLLKRLREAFPGPGPHRAFLVGLQGSRVVRYAFVEV